MLSRSITRCGYRKPVILGSFINALGLIHSFHQAGMRSIIVAWEDNLACYSRLSDAVKAPNPVYFEDDFIKKLVDIGKDLPYGGFLVCTDDATVSLTARYRKYLEDYYIVLGADWSVLQKCINKQLMYEYAKRANVDIPETVYYSDTEQIRKNIDLITYPCILKPTVTIGFLESLGLNGRTISIKNKNQLLEILDYINSMNLSERQYIIQEIIPGGTDCLYTITAYCRTDSTITGYSTGHKIRQQPPDAGTIMTGKVIHTPELLEPAQRLVTELGFTGICNIEFKKSGSDDFKLIEINARPGMWNYSATATGVNLAWLAYRDLVYGDSSPMVSSHDEIIWILFIEDMYQSLAGWKRSGYSDHSLSFIKWFSSIRGRLVDPRFCLVDPGPYIYHIKCILQKLLHPSSSKKIRNSHWDMQ